MSDDKYGDGVVTTDQWTNRWKDGRTGFHRSDVNDNLEKHVAKMINGRSDLKIFFPLCGKAVDMKWLADQGHTVVGVDVCALALEGFFKDNNLEYTSESTHDYTLYKSKDEKIRLYLGDFFTFNSSYEGKMDAFFDRGSLVAINKSDRSRYRDVIVELLAPGARGLLVTYDYDPTRYNGPPHFIPEEDIFTLYDATCKVEHLEKRDVMDDKHKQWGLDYFISRVHLLASKNL